MSDLLAIGEALVELNQPNDGAPFVQGFGGDTSNAMIAAARLGADAAYFAGIGADRFGQALTELWLNEGVDASRIVVNGGAHTGLYFVTHSEQGHEFFYMRAGSAASRIAKPTCRSTASARPRSCTFPGSAKPSLRPRLTPRSPPSTSRATPSSSSPTTRI